MSRYAKYNLTPVNASSSNHDKGIVQGADGKYYQMDGFKHGQKDGLDKDKSSTFKTSIKADGAAAGFTPSNFNTAGDVENALRHIGLNDKKEEENPYLGPKELSPELAHAKARVQQHEEDIVSGKYTADLYDMNYRPDGAQSFLNRYKEKLGKRLENGNYVEKDWQQEVQQADKKDASTNSSKVASGANDNSLDTGYYARTGQDNRIRR